MTIFFDVPPSIEQVLASHGLDPSQAAKEAALVELFRQGHIDHSMFAQALGLSRYEADGVLRLHGVLLSISSEQLEADREGLRRLVNR